VSSRAPDILCPECGTRNPSDAVHCAECGHRLQSHGQSTSVWRRPVSSRGDAPTEAIPLLGSSQATTPFDSSGPSVPLGPRPVQSPTPPPATPPPSGPPGCLLGFLGLLIIAIVAGFFAWSVGRSYVRSQVNDRIESGIVTQVSRIPAVTPPASGRIVITQAEVNDQIKAYAGSLDPIKDPVATIDRTGIHVHFTVYGRSSEFSGLPVAAGGKIVILKPKISGLAGQFVDADAVSTIVEEQLADLLRRSGVTPASITLADGSLTVNTGAPRSAGNGA
jgi:hypothetical protein